MFTGIVESAAKILHVELRSPHLFLSIARPQNFDDLKIGDSIAINGACLTVAELTQDTIGFYIGLETQKICGWDQPDSLAGQFLNLERPLKVGDRLHGHWVQGHVDARAKVIDRVEAPNWLELTLRTKSSDGSLLWKKGSVTLSGVSLTVNDFFTHIENDIEWYVFKVGLIPETLLRTNLGSMQVGDFLNVEFDWLAKAARASFSRPNVQNAETRS
jgi:riboflavin synthase